MVCWQLLCRPMHRARAAGTFQATVNNVLFSSGRCDGILYEEIRERQMFPGRIAIYVTYIFSTLCICIEYCRRHLSCLYC